MFQIIGLDHIALTVRDQERSLEWYQRILGMERRYQEVRSGPQDPVMACAGNTFLALFPPETAEPLPVPDHNVITLRHFAFRLDRVNFEWAQHELSEQRSLFILRITQLLTRCTSLTLMAIGSN